MDISPAHAAARFEACRLPALQASLALLQSSGAARARILLYAGPKPDPGAATSAVPLVALTLSATAGAIDAENKRLTLDADEGQVANADPASGTAAVWARVLTPSGAWWADLTVSDAGGNGDIKMASTTLFNGAFVRLTSAIVQS